MRDEICSTHPVIGADYRLLADDELLVPGDETACVSMLLWAKCSSAGGWSAVEERFYGKTVLAYLAGDMDAADRIFRRKKEVLSPPVQALSEACVKTGREKAGLI